MSRMACSAISMPRRTAGTPWAAVSSTTSSAKWTSATWRGDTLTHMWKPSGGVPAIWSRARSARARSRISVHRGREARTLATPRNSEGGTTPWPGRFHRTRASAPTIPPGLEIDDGLVFEDQLFVLVHGHPETLLDLVARGGPGPHGLVEELPGGLPLVLGPVHGQIEQCTRRRASAVAVGSPGSVTTIPMEAVSRCSVDPMTTGRDSSARMTSAMPKAACRTSRRRGRSTTNSSAPKRAMVSVRRRASARRLASSRRARSPTWWPKRSFTALKPSRSMKRMARAEWLRRQVARAWLIRSSSRAPGRGSPVRGS